MAKLAENPILSPLANETFQDTLVWKTSRHWTPGWRLKSDKL
jgi:hypothetical protein